MNRIPRCSPFAHSKALRKPRREASTDSQSSRALHRPESLRSTVARGSVAGLRSTHRLIMQTFDSLSALTTSVQHAGVMRVPAESASAATSTMADSQVSTRQLVLDFVTFLVVAAVASPVLALVQEWTGVDGEILRFTTFATTVGAIAVWLRWPGSRRIVSVTRTDALSAFGSSVVLALVLMLVLFLLSLIEDARWSLLDPSTLPAPLVVVLGLQVLVERRG